MNPDGVVCGNYRSSLAGVDLNRQWILPSQELHPEVYHTKALMHHLTRIEHRKILIYCDIHCHSKKKNSFLYGCNTAAEGAPFSTWTHVRLLPRLLARRSKFVSLPSCKFGIEACKLGSARVVVWKEFQVMNSFTLENSFYGYDYGPETRIYTQQCYRQLGASLGQSFNDYRVCLAQMEKEMIDAKGWLKPMKLKEITGIPAAQVIAEDIRQKRILAKRARQIRKYEERLVRDQRGGGFTIAPIHVANESKGVIGLQCKSAQKGSIQSPTETSPFPKEQQVERVIESPQESEIDESEMPEQNTDAGPPVDDIEESVTEQYDEGNLVNIQLAEEDEAYASDLDHQGASAKPSEKGGSDQGADTKQTYALEEGEGPSEEYISEHITSSLKVHAESEDLDDYNEKRRSSVHKTLADKVNELSGALEIEVLAIPDGTSSFMTKQDNVTIRDEVGVITPEVEESGSPAISVREEEGVEIPPILALEGKPAMINSTPEMKDSMRGGRDSCQTLLAESERNRRSVLQDNQNRSQQAMMRGKFGEQPKEKDDSSMLIHPRYSIQSSSAVASTDQYYDEPGEQIIAPSSNGSLNSRLGPNKVQNWRSLFDQDELNLAYHQSMIGLKDVKIEVKPGAKKTKKKHSVAVSSRKYTLQQIKDNDDFSENDDSADDDSVDDLNEAQLLRQVYMHKESDVRTAMRSTVRAQNKFFNEMQGMIAKKQTNQRPQAGFWSQVNQVSNNGVYYEPLQNFSNDFSRISQHHRDQLLTLTGQHIEKPPPPKQNEQARLSTLRPGKLQLNNKCLPLHNRMKNSLNMASRNQLLQGTSASLQYIEEILKNQKQLGRNVQPINRVVGQPPAPSNSRNKSRALTLSIERSLGSLGLDINSPRLQSKPVVNHDIIFQSKNGQSSESASPTRGAPPTKFKQYLLKVQTSDQDASGMKISLKQGIMKRSYREQRQHLEQYQDKTPLTANKVVKLTNQSMVEQCNENESNLEEEDPMLLSHRFKPRRNKKKFTKKNGETVAQLQQKAEQSQLNKRSYHIASRLRTSAAKKLVVTKSFIPEDAASLPQIQSESLSLKALASRQVQNRQVKEGVVMFHNSGINNIPTERRRQDCQFATLQLSEHALPKILHSQVTSARHNVSQMDLTQQVQQKYAHPLTTQRSSVPESPTKRHRPMQCESPEFETPGGQCLNADLAPAAESRLLKRSDGNLRATMYLEKQDFTPRNTSDRKQKRPSVISKINISINTPRAPNEDQSTSNEALSRQNISSPRTSAVAVQSDTNVGKEGKQLNQAAQLSARLNGISVGREVYCSAERFERTKVVEKQETRFHQLLQMQQAIQERQQSTEFVRSNSDDTRAVSSLLMASVDSSTIEGGQARSRRHTNDEFSKYLAVMTSKKVQEVKQKAQQEVLSARQSGVRNSEAIISAKLAEKLTQSLKMQTSSFATQHTSKTPRYEGQPLPSISQSIDNAKIFGLPQRFAESVANPLPFSDILEVQSHGVSDQSISEAGYFEDRSSLANLQFLKAGHTGISHNNSISLQMRIQGGLDSGVSCLRGQPPGLLRIQKGRHIKLTSILPSESQAGSQDRLPQLSTPVSRCPQRLLADMLVSHNNRGRNDSTQKLSSVPSIRDFRRRHGQ